MRVKHYLALIIFLTSCLISYSQTDAIMGIQLSNEEEENLTIKDLDAIKSLVLEHPEAYTDALMKFESLDTTLTYIDAAIVYFGYAYTPEYKGGYYRDDTDAVRELLDKDDYEGAYQKVLELRKINPASLDLLYYGIVSLEKGAEEREQMIQKFENLCDCITRFGKGTSNNPFRVIRTDDEYRFLYSYLNVDEITAQALTISDEDGTQCDAMSFKYCNVPFTLYFDVTEILAFNLKQLKSRSAIID